MESLSDIMFHAEDVALPEWLSDRVKSWVFKLVAGEQRKLVTLNYIFCSDAYLHEINLSYLDHDTYTDIITFDNSEREEEIEGDVFISLDRVRENAGSFDAGEETELLRVMAHGALHLCGYNDKTSEEKRLMREKENAALDAWTDA